MASVIYNSAKANFPNGTVNWVSDTLKVMLVTSAYTPDPDHEFVTSVNANELSGTGYTAGFGGAGRKSLASKVVTKNNTNDRAELDAADVLWSAINAGTIRYAVVIKEITNDGASLLVAALDFGVGIPTTGGDFTAVWPTSGLITLT